MSSIEKLLEEIAKIEAQIGYQFKNKQIIILAFIHRSFFNESKEAVLGHNERLEFLGDSVLGLIVSGYLYLHLPSDSEGHLSHLRAHLVGADSCCGYMRKLQLEDYLLLGKGESINVGRGRERILADLFEAIVGAIYLDGGLGAAEEFFFRYFAGSVEEAMAKPLRNWKADLQDYSQKKFQKPPEYRVLEEEGPAHNKKFSVAVLLEGKEVGRGVGSSKKQAEQLAAEDALHRLENRELENGKS